MTSSGAPGLTAAPGPAPEARPGWPSAALRARLVELLRFGSVGSVAFVVDLGTYNLLRFGPVDALHDRPMVARVVAVLLATLVSWLGNRHWTFADRRSHRHGRELVLFTAINVLGIGCTVGALWFWHAVLGLAGPVADNVANLVGIALGTVVRYAGYKAFVFTGTAAVPVALAEVGHEARTHGTAPDGGAQPGVPHPRPADD